MSTISPVGTKPPSFVRPSAHHSLKRTSSALEDSNSDKSVPRYSPSDFKRQKQDGGLFSASSPTSPIRAARAEFIISARSENVRSRPVQVVDGFFVGSEESAQSPNLPPPPFPDRPWKQSMVNRPRTDLIANNTGLRKRIDSTVQNIPYTSDTPQDAPRLAPDHFASFCPWMGNHLEDVMTEQVVKQGFVDKSLFSNESSSVRQSPSLFNAISKAGLQSLSSCLSAVVEERRAVRKISTESTFKPPPRATLTENKRKAWLNDLSDPTVPLKRLIRTIPQGIRGQSLLEQCRNSNIPVGRAVWFAKCVGANEIRFLKRKGPSTFSAGGEGKWLREWTINVEQFLEAALAQSEREGWRSNVQYSLNLADRLYSGSLLDHDHYLDWLAKSTVASTLEQLPTWLLLVDQHTADLLKYRKRAAPLVQSFLERLVSISKYRSEALRPLGERLRFLMRSAIRLEPSNFILPRFWSRYREQVEACLDLDSEADAKLLEQLVLQNEQLISPFSGSNRVNKQRKAVLTLLDSANIPFDMPKLSSECLTACDDVDMLAELVLDWALSKYRSAEHRPYLAARLLDTFHGRIDIPAAVTRYLLSSRNPKSLEVGALSRFIPEAIQLQVFSPSRYMQSLTAQGGLRPTAQDNSNDEVGFDASQVLRAIPSSLVSSAVWNLRKAMLRRVGYSLEAEAEGAKSYWAFTVSSLARIFPDDELSTHLLLDDSRSPLHSHSPTFNTAEYLRIRISRLSSAAKRSQDDDTSLLLDTEFCFIRRVLEKTGHFRALAEVIELCIASGDHHLLASLADTVNLHFAMFSATGHLNSLYTSLSRAYISLNSQTPKPTRFIFSLLSLGSRMSGRSATLDLLQKDLTRRDRGSALAACSPVSDFVAETLQQAGQTFVEEFEAVLSTGNTMEEQTMTQLFEVMGTRLQKGQHQAQEENDEVMCSLHARLRTFGPQHFDTLMSTWTRVMITSAGSRVDELLPSLIASQCLSYEACIDLFLEETKGMEAPDSAALQHLSTFLDNVESAEDRLDSISARLRLENSLYVRASPSKALQAWSRAAEKQDSEPRPIPAGILVPLVMADHSMADLPQKSRQMISRSLGSLLCLPVSSPASSLVPLAENTSLLSLPSANACLRCWEMEVSSFASFAESDQTIVKLFDLARNGMQEPWEDFLLALGGNVGSHIREKAEEAFFSVPIGATGRNPAPRSPAIPVASVKVYAEMIGRLTSSIPTNGVPKIASLVVERFSIIMRLLNTAQMLGTQPETSQRGLDPTVMQTDEAQIDMEQLNDYILLLLKITTAHQSTFVARSTDPLPSPAMPPKLQQDIVKLLALLVSVGIHPALQTYPETSRRTFDVAAMVVDDKPDELRAFCVRLLKDKIRDPRVDYLFGSANTGRSSPLAMDGLAASTVTAATGGLTVQKDGKVVGEFKARPWEMLEGGAEPSINLALFEARMES